MQAVRIRRYKVTKTGERGLITIPGEQMKNLGLEEGGELTLYAGVMDGANVLVLARSDEPSITLGK